MLKTKQPKLFKNLMLVVAGGYDTRVEENVQHLAELENLCEDLGLSSARFSGQEVDVHVMFLPSFTENQRTYLLTVSECLVYTPSHEHFGIVPLEAMYAGLPVIAVNNGGPTETIIHEKTGFLVPAEPDAFANCLEYFVTGAVSKSKMGQLGKQHVQQTFSLDAFIDHLETILYQTGKSFNMDALLVFFMGWLVLFLVLLAMVLLFISFF